MTKDDQQLALLQRWLRAVARAIETQVEPEELESLRFTHDIGLSRYLIDALAALPEQDEEAQRSYYSACIYALDIAIIQIKTSLENGHQKMARFLNEVMQYLAQAIRNSGHSMSFWMPILTAFYDVHVDLSPELQDAYLALAEVDEESDAMDEGTQLETIRSMILDMSGLSSYEIVEHFFAQSYAMPPDFFIDLVLDLAQLSEGLELLPLLLLHPKADVRDVLLQVLPSVLGELQLNSVSLSRLQAIKAWYPKEQQDLFDIMIRAQRKKGVSFARPVTPLNALFWATEMDGSGSQGIYVQFRDQKKWRLAGMLVKEELGIKDAWMSSPMTKTDLQVYFSSQSEHGIHLRRVNHAYLRRIANHFLTFNCRSGEFPDVHVMALAEALGAPFYPEKIALSKSIEADLVRIQPYTEERVQAALTRSSQWVRGRAFAQSWFMESPEIDKAVNRFSQWHQGVRICDMTRAHEAVLNDLLLKQRGVWTFRLYWLYIWASVCPKKREHIAEDALILAHLLDEQYDMRNMGVFHDIAKQSVINSAETMSERRTHLHSSKKS